MVCTGELGARVVVATMGEETEPAVVTEAAGDVAREAVVCLSEVVVAGERVTEERIVVVSP